MTPQVLTALAGTSGLIGFLSLLSYLYYSYRLREIERSERSVREIVEGEGLFNAAQVLEILREFSEDKPRLDALKALSALSNKSAERVYEKIKGNVDLRDLEADSASRLKITSIVTTIFFAVIAGIAFFYSAQSKVQEPIVGINRPVCFEANTKIKTFSCESTAMPRSTYIVSGIRWNDEDGGLLVRERNMDFVGSAKGVLPSNATEIRRVGACVGIWCPVECNDLHGWASSLYLTRYSDAVRSVTTGRPANSTGAIIIHNGPDGSCPPVADAKAIPYNADGVVVHSCQPGPNDRSSSWCEITFNGDSGWVDGRYLDLLPKGFVYLRDLAPNIVQDIRYAGPHNFVGRPIHGYDAPECVLTERAARALVSVQLALAKMGLSLIVWDCYRPERAVRQFVEWTNNALENAMKLEFYPNFDKTQSIAAGYLSPRSAHSRGSTVDVGILRNDLTRNERTDELFLTPCTAPKGERFEDGTIDLGTGFDCFDDKAQYDSPTISPMAHANRTLLREAMQAAGFRGIQREWWHFEFIDEPFQEPFDFSIPPHAKPEN
jgi:zinc D-Ala-D-Ala dipeptidase